MRRNITNQSVLKIITTESARRFNQYFTVFVFGKIHFLEYMNTWESLQQIKLVHANSDPHQILEPRQKLDSC